MNTWPQSNNPENVRLGLGCGQQWLSKPSCPKRENKCKAKPDWGQGVAWGVMVTEQASKREGMLNEAIVWPKWSTPHKEWHIQTVIQAYCCDGRAECCRSTYIPQDPRHVKQRELDLRAWCTSTNRKSRNHNYPEEPIKERLLGHFVNKNPSNIKPETWLLHSCSAQLMELIRPVEISKMRKYNIQLLFQFSTMQF